MPYFNTAKVVSLRGVALSKPPRALDDVVASFLLDRRANGATKATLDFYRFQLAHLQKWCAANGLDLPDLSTQALRAFLVARQAYSHNAVCESARRLRTFFSWCENEQICSNVSAGLRLPRREIKAIQPLSVAQVRALLNHCHGTTFQQRRDDALLRLLVDSGLRVGELVALDLGDLDLDGCRVFVRSGKGRKQRIVPVGARTIRALAKYLAVRSRGYPTCEALFIGGNGRRLTCRHCHNHISRLGKRAGIEGVRCSPHTLRHTFAKMFLERGGNVFALQEILGHSSLAMTRRYVALANADVAEAHRRASPGDLF